MKIINLQAENVKRIVAVDITPDGNFVEITGKNGQGKTSVLDSIWWALAGTRSHQAEPIRTGEEKAKIRIEFGGEPGNPELIVTRGFQRKKDGSDITTKIMVETADGARYNSPQAVLDRFIGSLAFDPLAFSRAKPEKQFDELKRFVPGVDFDQMDVDRANWYKWRTDENRQAKQARSAAEAMGKLEEVEAVVIADILKALNKARDENTTIALTETKRKTYTHNIAQYEDQIEFARKDADARIEQIEKELKLDVKQLEEVIEATKSDLEKLPDEQKPWDTDDLERQLETAEETNSKAAQFKQQQEHLEHAVAHEEASAGLTEQIEAQDKEIAEAIAAADMPVEGVDLTGGIVRLNGVPFEQASDAEQLRVSTAIAMSDNPKLRVIRIRDGSLLDDDSMELLREMAIKNDFQIWIERVDSTGKVGVVIEDGQVKNG